eukprot:NODE_17_length_41373_cov_0.337016.p16 type:complete len:274 gc:universal NODE_17_length_41373_cov_0.337016:36343-35522(-)
MPLTDDMSNHTTFNCQKLGGLPFYLYANRNVSICWKGIGNKYNLPMLKVYHSRYISYGTDANSKERNLEIYKNMARALLNPKGMVFYYRENEEIPIGMFYSKCCHVELIDDNIVKVTEPLRSHVFKFNSTLLRDIFANSIKMSKGLSQMDELTNSNFYDLSFEWENNDFDIIWLKFGELKLTHTLNEKTVQFDDALNETAELSDAPDNLESVDEAIDMESPSDNNIESNNSASTDIAALGVEEIDRDLVLIQKKSKSFFKKFKFKINFKKSKK